MASVTELDRLLECPICMESYTNPRMLPCIHSFCHTCLSRYIEKSTDGESMLCPVCKTKYTVPEDGVNGFMKNFFIKNIQDITSTRPVEDDDTQHPCSITECPNIATVYCQEGCEFLCKACERVHRTIKVSSAHCVVPVKNTVDEREVSSRDKPAFCQNHPGEELSFYCRDCKSCGCNICLPGHHNNHSVCEPSVQAETNREELRQIIQQVEQCIRKVEQHVEATLQQKQEAQSDLDRTKAHIIAVVEKLHARLEKSKLEVLNRLNNAEERSLKVITAVEDGQTLSVTSLKSLCSYAKSLLYHGTDQDVNEQTVATVSRSMDLQNQAIPTFKWKLNTQQRASTMPIIGELELQEGKVTDVCPAGGRLSCDIAHIPLKQMKKQIRGMLMFGGCVWLVQANSNSLSVFLSPAATALQMLHVHGIRDPTCLTSFQEPCGPLVISDWADGDKYLLHWVNIKERHCGKEWIVTGYKIQKLRYVPRGLGVTREGVLLVGNNYTHSVFMYNISGQLLQQVQLPRDVWAYTPVQDPLSSGLIIVDSSHITWVNQYGDVTQRYQPQGTFAPRDIAFDGKDTLYVADYKNNTVESLSSNGRYKGQLANNGDGLNNPTAVCVDKANGYMYVGHKSVQDGYELLRIKLTDCSTSLLEDVTCHTLNVTIPEEK